MINSDKFFLVQALDQEENVLQHAFNPLAQGFIYNAYNEQDPESGGIGTVAWFDIISQSMGSLECPEAPKPLSEGKCYILYFPGQGSIKWEFIGKKVYDAVIKGKILPEGPDFSDDESVQNHFRNLNPYG